MIPSTNTRVKLVLFLMFGFSLTSINLTISGFISFWQTKLFMDHIIKYFENYNAFTIKGSLMTTMLEGFKQSTEIFNEQNDSSILFASISITTLIIFFIAYKKSKNTFQLDNPKLSFKLPNDVKYPLFISLFFAVGLSFYFSTSFIESSMIETTSIILSTVQPFTDSRVPLSDEDANTVMRETVGGKFSLISLLIVDKTTAFLDSSFSQTYFFCIVGFLAFGFLSYYIRNQFFADAFFMSSVVGAIFWMFFILKIIPNLNIFPIT